MAEERKDKRDEGGAPPVGLADASTGQGFSLERFEALQQTLGQIGQSASAPGAGGLPVSASLIAKAGLALLVSLLGVGASQLALKRDQASRQDPFLPAPAGVDKNGFDSANPSAMPPGDPNAGSALTPPTGFSMGSVPAESDAQMVADAQKDYQKAVAAAKAAAMKPGVPQAHHLTGAPSAFKNGLEGTAALQSGGTTSAAAPGAAGGGASGAQAGMAKALEDERARYAAKLGGHAIGSRGGGRAFRQLTLAERRSRHGNHSTTGEGSAHDADSAFANNMGAGSPIGGGGLSLGGAGVTNGRPPSRPTASGPSEGAPIPAAAPQNASHKNATPWQKYVDIAKYMLIAASGLLLIACLLGMWANASTVTLAHSILLRKMAMWTARMAMVLGIVVACIGGLMLGQGQKTQGLIFTLSGAFVAVMAYIYAQGVKPPDNASAIVDKAGMSNMTVGQASQTVGPMQSATLQQGIDVAHQVALSPGTWTTVGGYAGAVGGGGGAVSSNATGGASTS